jgi:hypothetical protein
MSAPQPKPDAVLEQLPAPHEAKPQPDVSEPAEVTRAREFLRDHLHLDTTTLKDALAAVYGDAYSSGVLAGLQLDGSANPVPGVNISIPTSAEEWGQFWSSWTPGQATTSALLNFGGLARLLDRQNITIQGITGTTLDRLGTVLATGARTGQSVDSIARSMQSIVADPARARMIATTEIARAMTAGSADQYRQDGITRVDLVTSPGACLHCLSIAAENPLKLHGDGIVPVHPNCRCSLSPVLNTLTPGPDLNSDLLTLAGAASLGAAAAAEDAGLAGLEGEHLAHDTEGAAAEGEGKLHEFVDRYRMTDSGNDNATRGDTGLLYQNDAPNRDFTQDLEYGDNTGAGMNLDEENFGGTGTSILDRNTGAGGNGMTSNQGGSLDVTTENNGEGDPVDYFAPGLIPPSEPAAVPAAAPAAKPSTKRTRKRTRRTPSKG